MIERGHCPYCGSSSLSSNNVYINNDHQDIASIFHKCNDCGEYFSEHFKIKFIGFSSYGCNLFPAEDETEQSMRDSGIYSDD